MLRTSVLVCLVLITGTTAKPLKPWDKLPNEAVQRALVSIDDKGMVSWGVEVEPPEDMDDTSDDIDPLMKIWNNMKREQNKQHQMAEEDLDELQHPSTEVLLKVDMENSLGALSAADMQSEEAKYDQADEAEEDRDDIDHPLFNDVSMKEPEQDLDDVYHSEKEVLRYLAPLVVGYKGDGDVHVAYSEPEKDEDQLYHADVDSSLYVIPLQTETRAASQGRLHLEPEEDMDDIYHADPSEFIPYKSDDRAVPIDRPQRKYSEPEEDLDDIYHA